MLDPEIEAVDPVQADKDAVLPRVIGGPVLGQAGTAARRVEGVDVGPPPGGAAIRQAIDERQVPRQT